MMCPYSLTTPRMNEEDRSREDDSVAHTLICHAYSKNWWIPENVFVMICRSAKKYAHGEVYGKCCGNCSLCLKLKL